MWINVPITMFSSSLAVLNHGVIKYIIASCLNQQTLGRTNYVHCFDTHLTEGCLVFSSGYRRDSLVVSLSIKTVSILRPGPMLMVS